MSIVPMMAVMAINNMNSGRGYGGGYSEKPKAPMTQKQKYINLAIRTFCIGSLSIYAVWILCLALTVSRHVPLNYYWDTTLDKITYKGKSEYVFDFSQRTYKGNYRSLSYTTKQGRHVTLAQPVDFRAENIKRYPAKGGECWISADWMMHGLFFGLLLCLCGILITFTWNE